MEPFKNIYNKKSLGQMAISLKTISINFDDKAFLKDACKNIEKLEMKERVDQIAMALHKHLQGSYKANIKILIKTLKKIDKKSYEVIDTDKGLSGFILWPYTRYIELYGLKDIKASLHLLYEVTQRFTGEFGIRPFIDQYPNEVFKELEIWSKDKNHHVRRLVSEGIRPNLPWGLKSKEVNNNLKRNRDLIYPLYNDPSEYVRKSVANHLNDISRLDEKLFIQTIKKLKKEKQTKEKDWLITHACRSLFKAGHPEVLKLNGYNPQVDLKTSMKVSHKEIREGDSFDLDIKIKNQEATEENLIIDYIIHYPKKNGQYSPKVFRLKKIKIKSKDELKFQKKIHFKKVTTRVHYKGKHIIQLQINGQQFKKISFELK